MGIWRIIWNIETGHIFLICIQNIFLKTFITHHTHRFFQHASDVRVAQVWRTLNARSFCVVGGEYERRAGPVR